jgi:hypothetical protein
MSTESNEQFRAGFEAAARRITHVKDFIRSDECDGYRDYVLNTYWLFWCAAMQQRKASTEPSASSGAGQNGSKTAETRMDASFEVLAGAASALTDDAKNAVRLEYVLAHGLPMKWFDNDGHDVWRYTRINEWSNSPREAIDAAIEAQAKAPEPKPDDEPPWRARYRVKIRRDIGLDVRPEADQLDGKEFEFTRGWAIEEGETYPGEWAMIPADLDAWPRGAPSWVATGDLVELKDGSDHGQG